MAKSNVKKGSLILFPKIPLSMWSATGDPDFWKIGIVLNKLPDDYVSVYSNSEQIETVHVNYVREIP